MVGRNHFGHNYLLLGSKAPLWGLNKCGYSGRRDIGQDLFVFLTLIGIKDIEIK